jgi:hypothetical protein
MFDTTSDGRPFKVLSMCDEFTKECLEGPLGRSITADAVVVALDKAALLRGLPEHIRCDYADLCVMPTPAGQRVQIPPLKLA